MASELETIPLSTIDGQASSLDAYAGKVRLVVNVASKCGLTRPLICRRAKPNGRTRFAVSALRILSKH